jgi:hypothetical protein
VGYLDRNFIERAGRGMPPGFGNTQVLGRTLEIAMGEQDLKLRGSMQASSGFVANEWRSTLANHRELTVAHILKITGTCHHLLRITDALRNDPTPKSRTPIRRIGNEQK